MDFPLTAVDPQQAATSVSSSGTISWIGNAARVSSSAPVIGIIVAVGNTPLQKLMIINSGSYPMTMADSGTSNVADGVQCVIPPARGIELVWDIVQALWVTVNAEQFIYGNLGNQLVMDKL